MLLATRPALMPCAPVIIAVLMPITSPCASCTSGPPEVPGFSAASGLDQVLDHARP